MIYIIQVSPGGRVFIGGGIFKRTVLLDTVGAIMAVAMAASALLANVQDLGQRAYPRLLVESGTYPRDGAITVDGRRVAILRFPTPRSRDLVQGVRRLGVVASSELLSRVTSV